MKQLPDNYWTEIIEHHELERLYSETEKAWLSLGEVGYGIKPVEEANMKFQRSIYVVKDIKKGDIFIKTNIRRIRTGYGLSPKYFSSLVGKKAACDLMASSPLEWHHIQNNKQ